MHPVEEHLSVFDDAEGVLQVHISLADGLDLRAAQLNAGFVFVFNEVVVKGLSVRGQLFHRLLSHPGHLLSGQGNSIPRICPPCKGEKGGESVKKARSVPGILPLPLTKLWEYG